MSVRRNRGINQSGNVLEDKAMRTFGSGKIDMRTSILEFCDVMGGYLIHGSTIPISRTSV